jgi:cell division protein FtsB
MAETLMQDIRDFHDVVRLLEEHPEWRAELRRLVLTDDLLALPEQVARLTAQVAELVDAQKRTDAQIATLTDQIAALTQAVQRLTEDVSTLKTQVGTLTEDSGTLKADVATLKVDVHTLKDDVGSLKGKNLEIHYRMHSSPFFGTLLRHPYVLAPHEVADLLDDAVDRGVLSVDETVEIRRADMVVRGTRRRDSTPMYLVVEVSWVVDTDDVERAARRAALLAKTGLTVLPVCVFHAIPATDSIANLPPVPHQSCH